jgi:flagellar basal-body rod protein FlgF
MSDIFQIAGIGLFEGKQRLEAISQNAASASLPGYRRHVVTGRAFDAALATSSASPAQALSQQAPSQQAPSQQAPLQQAASQQVNLHPGSLMATGRPLDVAIDPQDLFFALTDGTQTWLTRAGAFRVGEDGVVVGERDLHVIGMQGDVRLPSSDVTVEADGRITYQGATVAELQLFKPTEPSSLLAAQGSLLSAPSGMEPAQKGEVRVRGGTLEASNTDAASEMLELMTLSRQFESLSRVLQNYDEALGRVIEKLGEG